TPHARPRAGSDFVRRAGRWHPSENHGGRRHDMNNQNGNGSAGDAWRIGRRGFLGAGALVTGALLAGVGSTAAAQGTTAPQVDFPEDRRSVGGGGSAAGGVNRAEMDLFDCEVEGNWPTTLDGVFYRVGPDPQYPSRFDENIAFDGEGHVSMFHTKAAHVVHPPRYPKHQ